jgi:hypothetical protein
VLLHTCSKKRGTVPTEENTHICIDYATQWLVKLPSTIKVVGSNPSTEGEIHTTLFYSTSTIRNWICMVGFRAECM